jgi:hypothetical protein
MLKILIKYLVFTACISLIFTNQALAADAKTTKAIIAAEEFLLLVDTSQYAQSWDVASSFFKSQVPKETWVKQISSVRPAFGKVINRQILKAKYMTQLPGAPDGQYVILQYDTTFENKRKAVETITPMLDKDGKWHVSGYFIQ